MSLIKFTYGFRNLRYALEGAVVIQRGAAMFAFRFATRMTWSGIAPAGKEHHCKNHYVLHHSNVRAAKILYFLQGILKPFQC